ncbi:ankyrin repeat domain-containing protein [Yoonia sp. 2307UL14-13]|uniref:ankyrin repeat domain-containing protein n=1 Tax=Yoonia sp. 2307UL14-13 TaxID=3126506 RepID=UPI0030B7AE10
MKPLILGGLLCALVGQANAGPLDDAIRQGDVLRADAAIDDGASIDAPIPPFMMTPLAMAAIRDDLPMVDLLLSEGADPDAPGLRGMNALSAAVRSCTAGADVIAALIDAGADLEDRSGADLTPLMAAIQEERTDIALLLMDKGADVNVLNQYRDGVLNYAIYTKNPVIVQAAMAADVDLTQLDILFTTGVYYYPGFGSARPHCRSDSDF